MRISKVFTSIALASLSLIGGVEAVFRLYPPFGASTTKKDLEGYIKKNPYISGNKFTYPAEWELKGMQTNRKLSSRKIVPEKKIPAFIPDFSPIGIGDYKFTWFGHSSVLLQADGVNVFIDPVLSERFFPIPWLGPKRFSELPVNISDLPDIDVVLITHDHHDHLEPRTIKALDNKVSRYIVPLGVEKHLIKWGIDRGKIESLAWWENTSYRNMEFNCTPSRHFSGRRLTGQKRTEYCSWVIKTPYHSFFDSGDGSIGKHFGLIHERFGDFDLAFMECGQYNEKWHYSHMYPEESVHMAKKVGAKVSVPVHWGSFVLSEHAWDDPIRRFVKEAGKIGLDILAPGICQTIRGNDNEYTDFWDKEVQ